jgi:hypothetical protein
MRITSGIVRRVGCKGYDRCLKKIAARIGKPREFNCAECPNYEQEVQTSTERITENLRAANLIAAIWPELIDGDPAEHEELNAAFSLPMFVRELEKAMQQQAVSVTPR